MDKIHDIERTTLLFKGNRMGIHLLLMLLLFLTYPISGNAQQLKRKGKMMGVVLRNSEHSNQGVKNSVYIERVFKGSAADKCGLLEGDTILSIENDPVINVAQFLGMANPHPAGQRFEIEVKRAQKKLKLEIYYSALPKEEYDNARVQYEEVEVNGNYHRSLVTIPNKKGAKHPAIFYIQGYGCNIMDRPFDAEGHLRKFIKHFSDLGYVTYRIEKSGNGDSEGKPCDETTFFEDSEVFLKGLQALKKYEFVDTTKVLLFGHSLGGIWAPKIASQENVLGIAVFGTVIRPWQEYMLENARRQRLYDGEDYALVEQDLKKMSAMLNLLLIRKYSPKEIADQYPQYKELVYRITTDDSSSLQKVFYKTYEFIQQLHDINVAEYWKNSNAYVLSVWGTADYVSDQKDHIMIRDLVNSYRPGTAKYAEIRANHNFEFAYDMEDCYHKIHTLKLRLPYNEEILHLISDWAREVCEVKKEAN